jgi:hypothetical protein
LRAALSTLVESGESAAIARNEGVVLTSTRHEAKAKVAHVSNRFETGRDAQARKTSRRRSVMDNSRSMQPRSGWTWKVWVGIVVGLAVVAGLIVLIAANAGGGPGGGGSGGIY